MMMSSQSQRIRTSLRYALLFGFMAALFAMGLPRSSSASDFGGVGVGTQLIVVDTEAGSSSGLGVDVRARFLWFLGIDWSATHLLARRRSSPVHRHQGRVGRPYGAH